MAEEKHIWYPDDVRIKKMPDPFLAQQMREAWECVRRFQSELASRNMKLKIGSNEVASFHADVSIEKIVKL